MTVFQWMRKYGVLIFFLPIAVYWIDDFLTHWHYDGTESMREIVWENLYEDVGLFVLIIAWMNLRDWYWNTVSSPYHCICPHCHHEWVTSRHNIQNTCPRCGKTE